MANTTVEQLAAEERRTCRHFNGIQNTACRAGVVYTELGEQERGWAIRLPCLIAPNREIGPACGLRRFPTEAEALASATADLDALDAHVAKLNRGECPRCQSNERRQAGRCAYCARCGTRLGQVAEPEA